MVNIDEWLCGLPVVGRVVRRLYAYFKRHTAFTDLIHVSLGLGVGLIVAGFFSQVTITVVGSALIALGIIGHVYAFVKGAS